MKTKDGLSERVRELRRQSLETEPMLSIERALLLTESYEQYEGKVSTPILRALAFWHLMQNKAICIQPGELIVGERGPSPQSTPTYPELCCHSLEDFDVINQREKISFRVCEEARRIQQQRIIPYWRGRSIRDRIFEQMSDQWKDCYEAGIFTEFMEQRSPGHTACDDKIYRKGMLDFKSDIRQTLEKLDFVNDLNAFDKREQLRAMDIACDALILLAERYARNAEHMAQEEPDEKRRAELVKIAEVCRHVPAHPPRSFHEALQMYWFVHLGVIIELNTWDSFCPGHMDQHLESFYHQELAAGTLTREEAKELLECFFIKFNNQPAPPKVGITLKESATYTDFCNINLGGINSDGENGVCDMTYLFLEVIREMRILQPSSNVQISRKNPDRFVMAAAAVIREGMGFPSAFNADLVVEELLRQGKTIEDARAGGTSGCVEVGSFGREAYILTGYFNMVKVLEITLHDGLDPETGKRIGISTGSPDQFTSLDDLINAFQRQMEYFIDVDIEGNHIIESVFAKTMPAPFLSVIIDDCIKNAKDYNAGGARYNSRYIQFVGLGSITDCFSAINRHVFEDQRFTIQKLIQILEANFFGYEKERLILLNRTPKYGNDDDQADRFLKNTFEIVSRSVEGRPTPTGGVYRVEMLPTTCHIYFGTVVGATPDGRYAHSALSEGISPVQGADRHGPTAVIKSAAKIDHIRTGGTLLNQKLTPSVLAGETGLAALNGLIRTYFNLGGHHIQFNVVDGGTLRDAQVHPENYESLIVRVAGYSDYFNNLTPELQNEIISRTEQTAI